jgi:hypothetical protein
MPSGIDLIDEKLKANSISTIAGSLHILATLMELPDFPLRDL